MAKAFSKCKLCGGMKFVNYAGMCKKCNRKKEGHDIMEKALVDRLERIDSRKKEVVKEAADKAVEDAKTEAEAEETADKQDK